KFARGNRANKGAGALSDQPSSPGASRMSSSGKGISFPGPRSGGGLPIPSSASRSADSARTATRRGRGSRVRLPDSAADPEQGKPTGSAALHWFQQVSPQFNYFVVKLR